VSGGCAIIVVVIAVKRKKIAIFILALCASFIILKI
jgi:hypothetical protein